MFYALEKFLPPFKHFLHESSSNGWDFVQHKALVVDSCITNAIKRLYVLSVLGVLCWFFLVMIYTSSAQ